MWLESPARSRFRPKTVRIFDNGDCGPVLKACGAIPSLTCWNVEYDILSKPSLASAFFESTPFQMSIQSLLVRSQTPDHSEPDGHCRRVNRTAPSLPPHPPRSWTRLLRQRRSHLRQIIRLLPLNPHHLHPPRPYPQLPRRPPLPLLSSTTPTT